MLPLFLSEICDPEQVDDLSAFYEKYQGELIRFAKTLLWRYGSKNVDTDAEDVVQGAFYKLIKGRLLDFSKGEKSVKAYVIMTVECVAKDLLSRTNVIYSLEEDEDFDTVSGDFLETILIRENYEIVVSELEKMDSIYNYTQLLRMQEWKPKEIARYMNVPVDTVNTRIKRGVKMLIERLEARKYSGQV